MEFGIFRQRSGSLFSPLIAISIIYPRLIHLRRLGILLLNGTAELYSVSYKLNLDARKNVRDTDKNVL